MENVCIIGCGAIGSLFAAHLSRVANIYAFVRRENHARALNEEGLKVTGTHEFHATLTATTTPDDLPDMDLGISAVKATQTETAIRPVVDKFHGDSAIISSENGLGSERIIHDLTGGYVIRATTFMSGTRHSDSHVEYELDAPTWMGPYELSGTPFELVQEAADMIVEGGLKAEALRDARPAQWSKLIFNASVNSVAALTELPHCPLFAEEDDFSSLGHLLHDLIDEGKEIAQERGIELHEDPWEMNKKGAQTNHPPSMLYDVQKQYKTEVDFLSGALAREAREVDHPAPLHSALYRLIRGKEDSWEWDWEQGHSQ